MSILSGWRLAVLSVLGVGGASLLSSGRAIAQTFSQSELNSNQVIAVASPYAGGTAHQLLILEQVSNSRACWKESGSNPTTVDPLLLQFDFTGICDRRTDSNGYSLRVGGQDLGWRYSLRIVKQQNDLVLVAAPVADRNGPTLELGRTRGLTTGFAKIQLNPGWRLTRRSFQGQLLGHTYLTSDQSLASLNAAAIAARPNPPVLPPVATRPTIPTTPPITTRPTTPTTPPVVTRPTTPLPSVPNRPTPPVTTRPSFPSQPDLVVPTVPIGVPGTNQPPSSSIPIPVPPPETGNPYPGLPALSGSMGFNLPEPNQVALGRDLSLWATYYYVHRAQNVVGGEPLLDMSGRSLGVALSQKDWCAGAVEGTLQVMDGQQSLGTYNYAGTNSRAQVNCTAFYPSLGRRTGTVRFMRTNNPFGDGVQGNALVPYRTIAVDRSIIPIGSVIYIPQARGVTVTLPSGERVTHDGYFFAADVGGAIRDRHIDVFLGVAEQNPFPFVTSSSRGTFQAYLVEDPQIKQLLASLHRPGSQTASLPR